MNKQLINQFKHHSKRARQVLGFAWARGVEQHIAQVAGSLTFTTVLSLVPMIAVALALFTAFPLFAQLRNGVEQFLFESLLPAQASSMIIKYINQFAAKANGLTVIGLLFLGITAISMLLTMDRVLNNIWRVKKRRPLLQRILVYWAVLTLGPLLLGVSISVTSYLTGISTGLVQDIPLFGRAFLEAIPIVLTGFAYAGLFVVIPNRHVLWRDALVGGFIAAILVELAKGGFAFYISRFPTYTAVYGTFAVLPIFFLWIYLSWLITLFGATLAATLPMLRGGRWERQIRPGTDFADALTILHVLYKVRNDAPHGLTLEQLCHIVKINPYDGERLLLQMRHLGYIVQTTETPSRWVWVADAGKVTAAPLYERLVFEANYLVQMLPDEHKKFAPVYAAIIDIPLLQDPLQQIFSMSAHTQEGAT